MLEPIKTKAKTVVNKFVQTGYREKVEALGIGDITTAPWQDAESVENLRSAMLSCGIRAFGKGSCTTDIDRASGSVTILRVA